MPRALQQMKELVVRFGKGVIVELRAAHPFELGMRVRRGCARNVRASIHVQCNLEVRVGVLYDRNDRTHFNSGSKLLPDLIDRLPFPSSLVCFFCRVLG